MEHPRLYITLPTGLTHTVELAGTTTIGRDGQNDVVLAEDMISRCHAVLFAGPQGMLLIDLDSTNGTLLNGTLVLPDTPVSLEDGDLFMLGGVIVRYHDGTNGHLDTEGDGDGQPTN